MSCYKTYIASRSDQVMGENMVDEWQAYIAETIGLIESTEAGTPTPNDSVEGGAAEFLYYNASAMQALLEKEPGHLEKANVKAIFAMLAEKTRFIYDKLEGNDSLRSAHTKKLFIHMQTNPEAEPIREALKQIYGAVWTKRVLGFE